jgi:hypothetical protein
VNLRRHVAVENARTFAARAQREQVVEIVSGSGKAPTRRDPYVVRRQSGDCVQTKERFHVETRIEPSLPSRSLNKEFLRQKVFVRAL